MDCNICHIHTCADHRRMVDSVISIYVYGFTCGIVLLHSQKKCLGQIIYSPIFLTSPQAIPYYKDIGQAFETFETSGE
jgi:hypothetical protein